MRGVAVARPAPGKPLLHGRVGPDVARRGVAAERGIAAHDPFAFGVDDRRAVAHGDGIDRPAEILRPGGDPALFQARQLRALPEAHGVPGSHAVGAHPYLGAAVRGIRRIGLVQRARAARGHDRGLRPEHVEFPVADAEAHRPDAAALVHEQPGARDAVVHVGPALESLFRHDWLELLAVDGNVPFAAVAHVPVPVPQDGQAPAFEVFHGLVQLLGIGKCEILAERPAAHLRAAPPDQIFRRLPFGDVRVDGVHACGTGAGTHDLRLFHDHDLERGIKLRRFRRHETPGVAAADDQEIACDDLHFDV